MGLTQMQIANGTGPQADQRHEELRMPAGGWDAASFPQMTPHADIDWGKLGATGYGPQYDKAVDIYRSGKIDPSLDYAALFGTITPQARVGGIFAGAAGEVGGTTLADPANGGGANNAPAKPAATPQQAGDNNSMMPGWATGNDQVGTPAPEGTTKPLRAPGVAQLPGRTATDPLNVAMAMPAVEYPAVATAGPAGGQLEQPVTPQVAAAGEIPVEEHEAFAPAGAPPAADDAAKSAAAGGTVEIPHGVTIHGKDKGTTFAANPITIANANKGSLAGAISQVKDPYLVNTMDYLYKLIYGSAHATGGSWEGYVGSGGKGVTNPAGLLRKIDGLTAFLKSRGVNWDPKAAFDAAHPSVTPAPGGDGTGGTGGTGGGTGTGGDGGVGGQADQPGSNTQLNDLDINAALSTLSSIMGGGKNDPAWRRFLGEMAFGLAQYNAARQDQQDAVDIQAGANEDFKNDPLRLKEEGIMSGMLDHPDPTPWDLVHNQTVTGSHIAAADAESAWSHGAARRMGPAGAASTPGVFADARRASSNELQDKLAHLEIEKAATGRNYGLQTLSAADQFRKGTTGADAELATILANMRRGAPQVAANPIQGAGEGYANSWAQSGLENQGSNAGDFMSWMKGAFGGASDGTQAGNAGATQHSDVVGLFGGYMSGMGGAKAK
jgi:hypothetical protein